MNTTTSAKLAELVQGILRDLKEIKEFERPYAETEPDLWPVTVEGIGPPPCTYRSESWIESMTADLLTTDGT